MRSVSLRVGCGHMSRLCTYGVVGKSIFVSVRCAVFAVVEWIDESRAGEYELGHTCMKMRRETVKIPLLLGYFWLFLKSVRDSA